MSQYEQDQLPGFGLQEKVEQITNTSPSPLNMQEVDGKIAEMHPFPLRIAPLGSSQRRVRVPRFGLLDRILVRLIPPRR